ncbi:organic cation transporter protein-like [Anneissia japonica]|uniref:organic cation transporter protein-like n=1 Tax=Anneissia japonica TaxID=1529436 RepID=UPI001425992E|nr:organic cation transporter protein-like [Anneissia japonica]
MLCNYANLHTGPILLTHYRLSLISDSTIHFFLQMSSNMNIDKFFKRIGSFGRYQILFIIILSPLQALFPSWQVLSPVFIMYEPQHRCKTVSNVSIPIQKDGTFSKCSMYNETNMYLNETTTCEKGWEYDISKNAVTLVSELNLVCDKAILAPNAVSIMFCGVLFGALSSGQLSDMFGRKMVAWVGMVGWSVVGIGIAFTHSYIIFVIMWFILAMCVAATFSSIFILILELFPPEQRSTASCISPVFWGTGLCLLAPIGYLFQNWRYFQLAITFPVILFLPGWWFVVESPRWLQSQGRMSDLKKVLVKMAKFNGVDPDFINEDQDECKPNENTKKVNCSVRVPGTKPNISDEETNDVIQLKSKRTYTFMDTVRTSRLRIVTIVLSYMWFVNSLVYYGLSLNSSSLAGNRFVNFFIIGVADVAAHLFTLWALPRFARRRLALVFHVIASVGCVLTTAIPQETDDGKDLTILIIAVAFIGKCCITVTFALVWVYTSEIYPTVIRNIGLGECSTMARIGGMCAPYIMYTGRSITWIPMVLFATLSLFSGLVALLLSETLNRPLPETIKDGEDFKNVKPVTLAYSPTPAEDLDYNSTKI